MRPPRGPIGRGKLIDDGNVTNLSVIPAAPGVRYVAGELNLWLKGEDFEQLAMIARTEKRGEPINFAEAVFRRGIQASLAMYRGQELPKGMKLAWRGGSEEEL